MIIINVKELNLRLAEILLPAGFYKKGNAFFRLHGDGVLQTLKWMYELKDKMHYLSFDLTSLYGEINPSNLTPTGCYPIFWAMHLIDKDYYHTPLGWKDLTMTGTEESLWVGGSGLWRQGPGFQEAYERAKEIHLRKMSYETQLEEVERVVLPVLNGTDTQDRILETMFRCERKPESSRTVFPLICCGRYQEALEIIQYDRELNRLGMLRCEENHQFQGAAVDRRYYEQFLRWEETILRGEEAIHAWLQDNYLKNQAMFEEMIPPKRRGKKKVSEK